MKRSDWIMFLLSIIIMMAAAMFFCGLAYGIEPEYSSGSCFERAPVCASEKKLMCLCYESGTCVWSCR